jgi:DNA-binding NarL/FixJ family response regulator
VIRVAVAARSSVVRAGLEAIVRSSASLELANALDLALVSSVDIQADVVLLDIGDATADRIAALAREIALPIVLLVEAEDAAVSSALKSGIRGMVRADASAGEIEGAIQAVHAGLVAVSPGLLGAIVPLSPNHGDAAELEEPLSDREREVLDAMVEGLSNKLIAHRLGISEHTVKTHVASILAKLGVSSRTEAVSRAIRLGLVML